jgi:hypothetical protein
MGLGSLWKAVTKVPGIGQIAGGVLGAAGGALGASAANKASKVDTRNQTASNRWQHKLDTATYGTERMPGLKKAARTGTFRKQIAAAIANNPKYGLQNLLPGYFNLDKGYTAPTVVNPYEAAGAPPEMQAAKTSVLGGLLGGAAKGAVG